MRLSRIFEGLVEVWPGWILGAAFIAFDVAGLRWLWVAATAALLISVVAYSKD